jgi:regulator of RNase E activity RraA
MRDLDQMAPGFQVLAGKLSPSHAFVHVVDVGIEVDVFGMLVRHGDLVHADRHGAVVIPRRAARELPRAVDLGQRRERLILDAAARPDFTLESLRAALAQGDEIH